MSFLFSRYFWLYIIVICLGVSGFYFYQNNFSKEIAEQESTLVKLGSISQTITVSGKVEAKKIAKLGFPVSGTIKSVYKNEGDLVTENEVIASLISEALVSEYAAALEQVRYLKQVKQETVRGPVESERAVARSSVQVAEATLGQVKVEYQQAVTSARQNLLSNDLEAYSTYVQNDNTPPVISGNYLCAEEGAYIISLFGSKSTSGLSYYLSGLGSGTHEVSFNTALPLGECGLYIKFSAGESYLHRDWVVQIPNKRSSNYLHLKNSYETLLAEQVAALQATEDNLQLAKDTEAALLAPASQETLAQADAKIAIAQDQLDILSARIADYTIRAPFAGVVGKVNMKIGEPTSFNHYVTVVYDGDFELKARVPEIDITKLALGNKALVIFDAAPETKYEAIISFISPISSTIGGVSYYDTIVELRTIPPWLREGLNADITIENQRLDNVSILPKRFISNANTIFIEKSGVITEQNLTTGLISTDGYAEVPELEVGTKVFLP